jgi:sodium transport system permease protein
VVVLGVSLLPMLSLFNQEGEKAWHLWVPALAQSALMSRVLKGEAIGAVDLVVPAAVSGLVVVACLLFVARQFARATA